MSKHFVWTLAELSTANDPVRYFSTVETGSEKRILYFNSRYIIRVSLRDKVQTGIQVKIRAPNHSLVVEEGKLEKELGVKARQPKWRTVTSARAGAN